MPVKNTSYTVCTCHEWLEMRNQNLFIGHESSFYAHSCLKISLAIAVWTIIVLKIIVELIMRQRIFGRESCVELWSIFVSISGTVLLLKWYHQNSQDISHYIQKRVLVAGLFQMRCALKQALFMLHHFRNEHLINLVFLALLKWIPLVAPSFSFPPFVEF